MQSCMLHMNVGMTGGVAALVHAVAFLLRGVFTTLVLRHGGPMRMVGMRVSMQEAGDQWLQLMGACMYGAKVGRKGLLRGDE